LRINGDCIAAKSFDNIYFDCGTTHHIINDLKKHGPTQQGFDSQLPQTWWKISFSCFYTHWRELPSMLTESHRVDSYPIRPGERYYYQISMLRFLRHPHTLKL